MGKVYDLCRVLRTIITVVLTATSGPDLHIVRLMVWWFGPGSMVEIMLVTRWLGLTLLWVWKVL
jgi:hypothetical protein